MKYLLSVLVMLTVGVAQAADRVKAKATTDLLSTFVTKSQSTTPDKALYYESDRDDVDNHSTTPNLSIVINSTANTIEVSRTDTRDWSNCSADYGTVTISNNTSPRKITINSDRKPVRAFCSTADGKTRGFFTTYKE